MIRSSLCEHTTTVYLCILLLMGIWKLSICGLLECYIEHASARLLVNTRMNFCWYTHTSRIAEVKGLFTFTFSTKQFSKRLHQFTLPSVVDEWIQVAAQPWQVSTLSIVFILATLVFPHQVLFSVPLQLSTSHPDKFVAHSWFNTCFIGHYFCPFLTPILALNQ